jgi:pilus assembly protein CpaB
MRTGSIVLVLGAAACAAAAALLTKSWLAANSAPPPAQVVTERVEKPANVRTVIVAARPLAFGTKLTERDLRETQYPADAVPEGIFTSKQALISSAGERVVLAAITENEPILASKITAPGQRASLSVVIEQGKKAVTIRVDDVLGVAGFVQPDDRVDILLTRNTRGSRSGTGGEGSAYTDVLLQDVRVLAIDQLADRKTQATPAKAVTVEVDTADAQKLVLAASIGQLSLALRRAGWSQQMTSPQRISIDDLLKTKKAAAPAAESPTVTITRATDRKRYEVLEGDNRVFLEDSREPQQVPAVGDDTNDALRGVEQRQDDEGVRRTDDDLDHRIPATGDELFGTVRAEVELPARGIEPPQKPE